MKNLILAAFVMIVTAAQAQDGTGSIRQTNTNQIAAEHECLASIQREFEQYKAAAEYQSGGTELSEIEQYISDNVSVGPKYDAQTDSRIHVIHFDVKMCGKSDLERRIIIVHELGHAMIHSLYPEIAKDAYSDIQRYSDSTHEAMANSMAVLIFQNDQLDQAFALMDDYCNHGNQYQCERVAVWRHTVGRQ